MIKVIDTNYSPVRKTPILSLYDDETRCFCKNTSENRRNALFAILLSNSKYDIEDYEYKQYAEIYADILQKNQRKTNIGENDIKEFINDLKAEFRLSFAENKDIKIFGMLATIVLFDQKNPNYAYAANELDSLANSVDEDSLFEL